MEERIVEWQQYGSTVISPLALGFCFLMWILILSLKREYKLAPFILIGCFMTSMQRIVILNINFPLMRITILIGIVMIFFSNEFKLKFNKIDKVMIWFAVSKIVLHTCLVGSKGLVEYLGNSIDTVLAYFLIRFILQDFKDFNVIMKVLSISSIIIALFMLNEKFTGRNWFSLFGGVPEFTDIREGKLRAQGAFSHAILAGTFGATLLPFMWAFWKQEYKKYALFGIISSFVIVFASASSGPVLTLMASCFGIFMWYNRNKLKAVKISTIILLILFQILWGLPVWFIIAKIDFTGGSTGYHRAWLIDAAIKYFFDWFICGTQSSGSWGWGLQDTTNQYIKEGINAGVLTLYLFIYIIKLCFNSVGKAVDASVNNIENQKVIWSLGVILFAHSVSFIGVSYFGHIEFFYYMLLAMISSLNNFESITNSKGIENKQPLKTAVLI